jgi:hypothetical protein
MACVYRYVVVVVVVKLVLCELLRGVERARGDLTLVQGYMVMWCVCVCVCVCVVASAKLKGVST